MRKSIFSIAVGAFITSVSLFLLSLAYPRLIALFGLLFLTACIILGLSIIAAIPKVPAKIISYLHKSQKKEGEHKFCRYCGAALPEGVTSCPTCGGPQVE